MGECWTLSISSAGSSLPVAFQKIKADHKREYGTGPAELQALQEMAAQWWQDVQHERQQGASSVAEADSE